MSIVLVSLLVLSSAAFIALYLQNQKAPELGVSKGMLTPTPGTPNAVSTQTDDTSKKVEPLAFKSDLATTMSALVKTIEQQEGANIIKHEPNYLYIVFTSNLFKFKDDAEFYLDEEARLVHFRSASRAGKSDLGVNRKRYEQLRLSYEQN